jgi:hypothetical protein
LHILKFGAPHVLEFSVSTSRILATDLNTGAITSNHYEISLPFLLNHFGLPTFSIVAVAGLYYFIASGPTSQKTRLVPTNMSIFCMYVADLFTEWLPRYIRHNIIIIIIIPVKIIIY